MFRKTSVLGLLGLSALLPLSAQANNFNYNYFEVRTAFDPEIIGAEFSTFLTENSHIVGRIDSELDGDWDAAAGVGFNGPVGQFADVYGQLLVHHINYTDKSASDSDIEAEFNIGGRLWLAEQLELTARLGKLGDRSVFHAGARFHSTQQLSLSLESRNNGIHGPQMALSVRFQY
ncbi:hypothetical protein J4N42_18010 [Vibrio sp. SCSIO 43135]|uniref:hypothetical protein n=1 Tax=Vibrio sp. SCSIO 43135 TaxID=2819096 RepID=UPI0020762240|nr:hypothetical protein [Vibrio sp. SCSIO 43135]USD44038.1 hypothetical protein J4N42_18010 [Vibrio sp. SCSIO 43135]